MRGSNVYNWTGDVRVRGDVRGSCVINAGNLHIEGDLRGSCVVNARNITIEGNLSGSPVVNASGKVVIEGDRSGSAVVNAAGGVTVKGDDLSQRQGSGGASFRNSFSGVSVGSGGVHVGGTVNGSGLSTDGSLSIMNGTISTSGATKTRIEGYGHTLEILGADIINGKVYEGTVRLNGQAIQPDGRGIVDLGEIKSPLANRFRTADRGPKPGNW